MKYLPKIGRDFPVHEASTRHLVEKTRSVIAIVLVGAMLLALLVAAVISLLQGNYGPLLTVWAIVTLPSGWIVGYYFKGRHADVEDDNEGSA